MAKKKTRFKCVICGKLTAGRISRDGRLEGDASARFPRRHKHKGEPCEGNVLEAEWIDVRS